MRNFKNVGEGTIRLSGFSSLADLGHGADVAGIYGQNGSGKTSLIQALAVIKDLMCGHALSPKVSEFIAAGQDRFTIELEFFVASVGDRALLAFYEGELDAEPRGAQHLANYRVDIGSHGKQSPLVLAEHLQCKDVQTKENARTVIQWSLDADDELPAFDPESLAEGFSSVIPHWLASAGDGWSYKLGELTPKTHWKTLQALNRGFASQLETVRRKTFEEGKSFVFSDDMVLSMTTLLGKIVEGGREKMTRSGLDALERVLTPLLQVMLPAKSFAKEKMAVLPTSHQGLLALSYLPLASHEGERGGYTDNFMLLDIESVNPVDVNHVDELEHALDTISKVVDAIVPGLRIEIARLGKRQGPDGEVLEEIELMSRRGDISVPLRNESEGIKKILSIISLLVDVHSDPSAFVAIDELDSGVFEYLLGELLSAIVENGAGQLVFTAHNLRPLEVLDSKNIWFTTVNSANKFKLSKGVRGSNNLRKMYLREIRLGGDDDSVYESTSPLAIDAALYDAGEAIRGMRYPASGEVHADAA